MTIPSPGHRQMRRVKPASIKFLLGGAAVGLCTLLGLASLDTADKIIVNGPALLFGQLAADRSSRRVPDRDYRGVEFILGTIPLENVKSADFIAIGEDVLFWGHPYLGFPRTALTDSEVELLESVLTSAPLLVPPASEEQPPDCVERGGASGPRQIACGAGDRLRQQFLDVAWEAEREGQVGVLQVHMMDGRLAEVRIWWSGQDVVFEPYSNWWIEGVSDRPLDLLTTLQARAEVAPVPVLWPDLDSRRANALARRRVGNVYSRARAAVTEAETIRAMLGGADDIRPAAGILESSSWMDSAGADLTFRVRGPVGEAAVLVRGYECFEIEMTFEGKRIEVTNGYVCP
jgi:hypothetical protein